MVKGTSREIRRNFQRNYGVSWNRYRGKPPHKAAR